MTWHNITVEQYQGVAKIIATKDIDTIEKQAQIVSLLFDISPMQLNDLTLSEYGKKVSEINFIFNEEIPGKAEKYLKANGKTYFINYQIEKHRFGQYIEEITFAPNYVENMHLLMASIVQPVTRRFGFKKISKNDSRNHEAVANDILKARFIDVYHCAVFFYRVFRGSMKVIRGYSIQQLMKKGMTQDQAETMTDYSISVMDGFITPKWLPSLKVSA